MVVVKSGSRGGVWLVSEECLVDDVEKVVMEVEAFLSPTYAARLEHGQRNVSQWLLLPSPVSMQGPASRCVCQQSRLVMA